MATAVPPRKIIDRELTFVKVLGSGSFGEVHLAEPIPHRKRSTFPYPGKVAVKIIHRSLCGPEQVAALLKELNALQRLQHPCIVGYLGVWVEASTTTKFSRCHCLAMSYCNGGDVDRVLRECRRSKASVSQETLTRLMACVFAGLSYSHAHRVIHRDIKPANVFLTTAMTAAAPGPGGSVGRALIGDYGLARPLDKTMQLVKSRVGTPCYCSPEIVAGEMYTSKTDMFSAGVMFYELMVLESPFWKRDFTDVQCFYQIIHHDPLPRFRQLCRGRFSESLVELVCRCLAKTEAGRPSAYEALTKFSSRLPRTLADMQIPLYAEKASAPPGAPAKATEGTAPASPPAHPAVAAVQHAGANAAANAGATRREGETTCGGSPHQHDGSSAPADVAQPTPQAGGRLQRQTATPAQRLALLLTQEFTNPVDGPLAAAVKQDEELFLLLKVLLVSRSGTRAAAAEEALAIAVRALIARGSSHRLAAAFSDDEVNSIVSLARAGCAAGTRDAA